MILSPPTQQALNCWVELSLHIWSICTVSRQRKPALWIQDVWVTAKANVFINAVRCRVKSQHNIAQVFSVIICVVLVSWTNVPCITDFEGHESVWTDRDGIHVDTFAVCLKHFWKDISAVPVLCVHWPMETVRWYFWPQSEGFQRLLLFKVCVFVSWWAQERRGWETGPAAALQ